MRRSSSPLPRSVQRADDIRSFVNELSQFDDHLSHRTWQQLFDSTSGWIPAGRAVVEGATSLGLDLDDVTPSTYPRIISIKVLVELRQEVVDSPELRLAHLLSFVRRINHDTINIAARAVPQLGSKTLPFDVDANRAVSQLVEYGVLRPLPTTVISEYEIPPVVRAILRRVLDNKVGHSEAKTRRALGQEFSTALSSTSVFSSESFDEILLQSAKNGGWAALAGVWAEHAHALFVRHLDATCEAYQLLPAKFQRASPVLAEARGAVEHIDSLRRRLGTDDPTTLLTHADFDLSSAPSLEANVGQIAKSGATADDIVVMAISAMQSRRQLGESSRALRVAEQGWELIREKELQSRPPSRLNDARFHLERGVSALHAGDIKSASHQLRRATLIGETAVPSPFLLGEAYGHSALTNVAGGSRAITDRVLRKFEDLLMNYPFLADHSGPPYFLTKMILALDALDLDAAAEYSARMPDPSLGVGTWVPAMLYNSILAIFTGAPNLGQKRIEQILNSNAAQRSAEPNVSCAAHISRAYLHLAAGHTHKAQTEILGSDPGCPEGNLVAARFRLSVGEYAMADSIAARIQFDSEIQLRPKASARAVQAASLLRLGWTDEAHSTFIDALEYCRIISSLTPIALLPKSVREELVTMTAGDEHWDQLALSYSDPSLDAAALRHRLLALGETLKEGPPQTHLEEADVQLMLMLDSAGTVAEVARHLNLAEGTVKNKLSRLYKRIGVRNWKSAVAYGYENGYLRLRD